MGLPAADEVVNGLTVSYLTSDKSPIDLAGLDNQVEGICAPAHKAFYEHASVNYLAGLQREETAITAYTACRRGIEPTSFDRHLWEYNMHRLNHFKTTLVDNLSYSATVLKRFTEINALIKRMSEKFDISTGSYINDPSDPDNTTETIQVKLYAAAIHLLNLKNTTNSLQMLYPTLMQERKWLLEKIDAYDSDGSLRKLQFDAVKTAMHTSANEMETIHTTHLTNITALKDAFVGCWDWMLRQQKLGHDPDDYEDASDEYVRWLGRESDVCFEPSDWEWNLDFVAPELVSGGSERLSTLSWTLHW